MLVPYVPEGSLCQGLTILAEALLIPRAVLGLESRLHVEKGTVSVAAVA